jgi:hypothetical protein
LCMHKKSPSASEAWGIGPGLRGLPRTRNSGSPTSENPQKVKFAEFLFPALSLRFK